jgi:hypothetical protein
MGDGGHDGIVQGNMPNRGGGVSNTMYLHG